MKKLEEIFYKEKVKIVPREIEKYFISPLSLAVWYMDDGTIDFRPKNHYAYRLNTHSFTQEENIKLVSVLKKNFKVEATVQNTLIRGKNYFRIHIGEKGRDKFYSLIKPYILECFSSKLPPKITFWPLRD